ncbi:MAG: septum site-determining protein MinC, partial [Candidatus Competibacterales bacterium]|nr:septum site-determining protein MinC [Candidatus Competibacterales bacterium]
LTVLQLRQTDLNAIERHLGSKIEQAPGFFQNVPVVLDLGELGTADTPDFKGLRELLRNHQLIPVGVRHGTTRQQEAATLAGLPVLPEQRNTNVQRPTSEPVGGTASPRGRLHLQPVRSGQQLYASEGDLVVIGPVSVGAELLADGNIHVYGPLRGRALAGVRGNTQARIFCLSLEAQLVSIAGSYRLLDEPYDTGKPSPVQIYLDNERLIIEPLAR